MADFYIDHGAYGLSSNRIGLDTPVWGIPQEGDGTNKDAANSSSIGSILFNSIPTSGNISICGASVSTTNVLNAATADAAADALATNINATTATVSSASANGTPQLRNLVYARGPSNGSASGTCEIMMRIGSTSLNYSTNSNSAIANTFDGSPTVTQFSGGSGGCYGWLLNDVAIGVGSSIEIGAYGLLLHRPYVSTISGADNIHCRTGNNVTISLASSASYATINFVCDVGFSKNIIFDSNLIWTSDISSGTITLHLNSQGYLLYYNIFFANASNVSLSARRRGGFKLILSKSSEGSVGYNILTSGTVHFKNISIDINRVDGTPGGVYIGGTSTTQSTLISYRYELCDFKVLTPRSTLAFNILTSGYEHYMYNFYASGCTFDFNINGLSDPGTIIAPVITGYPSYISGCSYEFNNCDFLGFASGYTLISTIGSYATSGSTYIVDVNNCKGLLIPNNYVGVPGSSYSTSPLTKTVKINNSDVINSPSMRIEDPFGVTEWIPNNNQPILRASIPNSGVIYSLAVIWLSSIAMNNSIGYEVPPIRLLHQLSTSVRTITLEMYIPDIVTSGVTMLVGYTDSTNTPRAQESDLIQSSVEPWTNTNSVTNYSPKKLMVTTDYPILANSEICVLIRLTKTAPDVLVKLFIDPEVSIV